MHPARPCRTSPVAGVFRPACCSRGSGACWRAAIRPCTPDEEVVGTGRVRELERRVRDLERLLGRKTMEVEILKEALDLARTKKPTSPLWTCSGLMESGLVVEAPSRTG